MMIWNRSKAGARAATATVAMAALTCGVAIGLGWGGARLHAQEPTPDNTPPKPVLDMKGVQVLFGGNEDDIKANWTMFGSDLPAQWKFVDGAMETRFGDIQSKAKFDDFQLHVEWREPYMAKEVRGQARGNSGVFLDRHFEIQVLDSNGIADPGSGDCGALYSIAAPLFNATKPPLQWQTYDIVFRHPRYDASGVKTEDGRVTVIQNGICVQNNTLIPHPTDSPRADDPELAKPQGIRLQYHHNSIRFRNVWVLPLPPHGASHY